MTKLRLLLSVLSIICLMLPPTFTNAQQKITVKGRVVDAKDEKPLPGATITHVNGKGSAIAGDQGQFEITVPEGSMLKVTMIGYEAQTIKVSPGMVVSMNVAAAGLEDVVVIGYGTQKKELLTSSIGFKKFTETDREIPTVALGNLLAGQVAGLRVATPTGQPGVNPGISIRQGTSWNAQNVLYIIDGKASGAGDFNNLAPNEIESITVLKDASSAAVYGMKSEAGVVVVSTRKGNFNAKPQLNYSFNTGVDKRGTNAARTSCIETFQVFDKLKPWTPGPSPEDYAFFKTINNGWGYDQLDAVWNDPSTNTHNLSISGGSSSIKYFVGGSYIRQGSFMKNLKIDKYNLRANITADVTKNIQLYAGIAVNNNKIYQPTNTAVGDVVGIYRKQLVWQPWQPVWTDAGNPIDYGWIANVGSEVRGDGGYERNNNIKPVIDLQLTYKLPFIKGLSASAKFNKSYTNYRDKQFFHQYDMWVMKQITPFNLSTKDADLLSIKKSSAVSPSYLREIYNWSNDYQLNLQLNYENTFKGGHHVKGWLVYEKTEANSGGMTGTREKFPVYLTDQWWATSSDRADSYVSGSTETSYGYIGWVGQAFYDYQGKYLANVAARYDGSYLFPSDKRWGFFPSGSLGWVVSKENFFNIKGIDMLKIRTSAGLVGNDGGITAWQWQQAYQNGNSFYLGTSPVQNVGITYGQLVNPLLTWEKTFDYGAGVDVNFLKHFNASFDYYFRKTYDILRARVASVPPTFPRTLPSENYAQINSHGFEFMAGYKNSYREFDYYLNFNASYGKAIYRKTDQNVTYPYQDVIGKSTTYYVAYETDGMIRTQAELDKFVAANPAYKFNGRSPELGQLIYKDISGPNGKPDGIVDAWDQKILLNDNNPVVLGLNLGVAYKGISLSATFNGYLHYWRGVSDLAGGVEWNRMWKPWAYDSWSPDNTNASLPKRHSANDGNNALERTGSSFWLKSANFLRLKSLNISYSLPQNVTGKIGFKNVQVYVSGTNLFILSKFNKKYYDPEISEGFGFPIIKSFNGGINITL